MKTVLIAAALTLAAPAALAGDTLYDDLGGQPVIDRVTDRLVDALVSDPRTAATFAHSDVDRVRAKLKLQLCEVADGPCAYDGLSMADSHMGHDLTEAHFNAMVEMARDAMDAEGVGFGAQNRLLARLAPMHGDVVTK